MADQLPLVVAGDETVLDEILRIAAAAGCEVERAADLTAAHGRWAGAPLVVVDEDALRAGHRLPRRGGVLLVCKGTPTPESWEQAFLGGAEQVISLPEGETELIGAFADVVEGPAEGRGSVIGVIGGRGGAGASVLAAAVGLAANADGRGLLVDCDSLGGGIDLVLGAEGVDGLRWPDLQVSGRVSMPSLQESLPRLGHRENGLSFLSCGTEGHDPTADAVTAVIAAGRRAGRTVVCDLPRHLCTGAAAAAGEADLVALVVPAEFRACLAAKQVLRRLEQRACRIGIVVRGPVLAGLSPGELAEMMGLPLLSYLVPDRRMPVDLERGEFQLRPKSPLATAAEAIVAAARLGTADAAR
ncbi:septum site-determining protein Ssd [Amycolatopsis sp. H20-H5]|uniref:septum site-determining protein Ssd n=1 Tax=Amycolatopsis sp. H20-H5 TaxID=3046309 RepID=UPI002DB74FE5|nr:septum site-determining protein Ssd [Amycolatopsis sp. H20-H5]MEC3978134.1 septum site-determining protein Ssd [Amycolatopsis sp. H20-H5]